jgi:hypothetical protein
MPAWLFDAVRIANEYPWIGPVRTAGQQLMSNDLPWWYIPAWYLVSLPTLTLILTLVSVGIPGYLIVFKRNKGILKVILVSVPLIGQGIAVPILMNVSGTILYDGIRHVLFAVPALVSLTVILFSMLHFKSELGQKNSRLITSVVLGILAITLFEISRWVPYEYAHKNLFHNIGDKKINWEMDYWGVSAREGTEKLLNEYGLTEAIVLPSGEMASVFGGSSITEIQGDVITLAGDHKIDRYFGVYLFNRYTWSETADLPMDDCQDVPLAKCNNLIPPKCKVLFKILHAGVELGKGAVCQDPRVKDTPDFSAFQVKPNVD